MEYIHKNYNLAIQYYKYIITINLHPSCLKNIFALWHTVDLDLFHRKSKNFRKKLLQGLKSAKTIFLQYHTPFKEYRYIADRLMI